jgi:ABC-2 type transport system permease protein
MSTPRKHGGTFTRAAALIVKETRQMLRDKNTLTLGIVLPIVLLLLFGYGLSLDVDHVPATIVEDGSPEVRDLYVSMSLSRYFDPTKAPSFQEAERRLLTGKTDAVVRRSFSERESEREHWQIIVNGRDANTSRIMQRYVAGAIAQGGSHETLASAGAGGGAGVASVRLRVRYNDALNSRHFLIPGLTALILTLIGTMLTALVMAREWERGTFEAMAATPVSKGEILAGKTVPYFGLGMAGLALCLLAARFIFEVPMRGSLGLIVAASALYLVLSLAIGLVISATLKSQLLASQIAIVVSFMPTVVLSGFIFDLHSAPVVAQVIAHFFPATWYVELLQTLFMAGNVPSIVVRDMLVLAGGAVAAFAIARHCIRKSLE